MSLFHKYPYEYELRVEGMHCSMCESHVNDLIRKAIPEAKKLKSSHLKGLTAFSSDSEVEEARIKEALASSGYDLKEIRLKRKN